MTKPEPGDKVKVVTREKEIEGILMPNEETDAIVVKLGSGYNVGIEREKVKEIKVIEKLKRKEEKKGGQKEKRGLPTISILHTGGTIASKVDYSTGGVVARFEPEEIAAMFPEISGYANIRSRLVRNMWSQDMRFSHYNILAKEAKKEIESGADGVIITHGTDTLHYTAAALAFILEGLPKPVLIVGSQRSSDRGSSDAAANLVNAAYYIASSDFGEVGICMHESENDSRCAILPATKTRKMHTSRRDAFKAINAKPWAIVDYTKSRIDVLNGNYRKRGESGISLKLLDEKIKVGVLRQHTNMLAEQFLFYEKYDGVVIEATGLGNPPTTKTDEHTKESEKIFNAIKRLVGKGVVVVLSPQTIFGRINLNVYSNQKELKKAGVLGDGSDMTTEATFIKLAWLLSNYKREEVKGLMSDNLRGEISGRSAYEGEFVKTTLE